MLIFFIIVLLKFLKNYFIFQTAELSTIFLNDLILFLGDVGTAVVTICDAINALIVGFWCLLVNMFSGIASTFYNACQIVLLLYCSVVSSAFAIVAQIGNLFTLIRNFFVLFGSSVMFLISLVPNMVCFTFSSLLNVIINSYLKCCSFFCILLSSVKENTVKISSSLMQFLLEVPMEALLGSIIGISFIISFRYLVNYMTENLIIIPDIPMPSIIISIRRWLIRAYLRAWRRGHPVRQVEYETEEEILEDSEDDDDDDIIIIEERQQQNQQIPPPRLVNVNPDQHEEDNRPEIRRPFTRSQRVLGLPEDVYESELNNGATADNKSLKISPKTAGKLFKELEEERDNQLCVVCQDSKKCVILLPCRHLCLCKKCKFAIIDRSNVCPVCRHVILETLNVFV